MDSDEPFRSLTISGLCSSRRLGRTDLPRSRPSRAARFRNHFASGAPAVVCFPEQRTPEEPMTSFSSLRFRLVGTVFLAVAPASVLLYFGNRYYAARYGVDLPWAEFVVGLLALGAAWFGGERFILRQVRMLSNAAQQLGAGDLSSRTGMSDERGELGELAHTFDTMAASLEERVKERERAERTLLNRAFQQTVVAALGQFAMVSNDIDALLSQAVMLVAQTLEVEFCHILELQPGRQVSAAAGGGAAGRMGVLGSSHPGRPAVRGRVRADGGRAGRFRVPGRGDPLSRIIAAADRPRCGQRHQRGDRRAWAAVRRAWGVHGAPAEVHGG